MLVILKLPTGGMKNLELEGSDSIEAVRLQVAAQTQVHPEHQRLILMDGDVELTDGKKTVADYGIRLESEIRLAPRPPPRVVDLTVGGVRHTTLLSTLSQVEGSRLARMFDGLDPIDLAAVGGAGGLPAGVPGEMSSVFVPRAADGSYVINRNGVTFGYILDHLRDIESADAGAFVLPSAPEDLQRLTMEAEFFGLPALVDECLRAMQDRSGGVGRKVAEYTVVVVDTSVEQRANGGAPAELRDPQFQAKYPDCQRDRRWMKATGLAEIVEARVAAKLAEGWTPLGAMGNFLRDGQFSLCFTQTMVKHAE
jgi:hypothetical protein